MPVAVESVIPGKCFVTLGHQVRRVLSVEDGVVTFEARGRKFIKGRWRNQYKGSVQTFAVAVAKEVPCHYDPDFGATEGL
jgi:hypothetical protein